MREFNFFLCEGPPCLSPAMPTHTSYPPQPCNAFHCHFCTGRQSPPQQILDRPRYSPSPIWGHTGRHISLSALGDLEWQDYYRADSLSTLQLSESTVSFLTDSEFSPSTSPIFGTPLLGLCSGLWCGVVWCGVG